MSKVCIVLLTAAMFSASAGVAVSQRPEGRDTKADSQAPPNGAAAGPAFRVLPPMAQRDLALSAEQQKQIDTLEADVQSKMEKILTAEQLKKWNERRTARAPRGDAATGAPGAGRRDRTGDNRNGRANPSDTAGTNPAGPRGADDADARRNRTGRDGAARGDRADGPLHRVIGQLDLSAEQKAKVDTALSEHREKVHGLFRQAQADLVSRMKEVLTDEQFQKFTKALENGPPGSRRRERSEDASRSDRQPVQP